LASLGVEQLYSYLIEESILGRKIDLILDPGDVMIKGPSTVVDFSDEEQGPIVVREGAGDILF
jgi:tRNA A37 threonylcarbamoyladenosine synthetase subunit TsaC/SUA5/YrdC